MNYQKIYDSIISNAKHNEYDRKNRKRKKLNTYERHHIIPKCMGGSNHVDNLVYLTPKEHFICHKLLCEIYPDNDSLRYALWCFVIMKRDTRVYRVSSREYERYRSNHMHMMSVKQKGKSVEERFGTNADKIRLFSSENNPMTGTNVYEIWVRKYGKDTADQLYSDYIKKNRESKLGKKRARAVCPHCNTETDVANIHRWHMDNCPAINPTAHTTRIENAKKGATNRKPLVEYIGTENFERYKAAISERLTGSGNPMFGKHHTDETRKKMRKPKSSTVNMKGPKRKVLCPVCKKEGGASNMTRYHFDNCKFKK